jgi:hypothetical protein
MPRLRSAALACGLAAALAGPCAGVAAQLAPSASAAPDPEGSGAVAKLGRARPLPTSNGRVVVVTVVGVRFRGGNHRRIDVRVRYALRRGGGYRFDPVRDMQLVDGSGNFVAARTASRRAVHKPPLLHHGRPLAEWVHFTLPTASGATRVLVTLEAGTAPLTGQWRIPARL